MKLLRKLIAFIRKTFVTDCPRCHSYFYGFNEYALQVKFDRQYRIVCHKCSIEHKSMKEIKEV